jgi:hypothetical protein
VQSQYIKSAYYGEIRNEKKNMKYPAKLNRPEIRFDTSWLTPWRRREGNSAADKYRQQKLAEKVWKGQNEVALD